MKNQKLIIIILLLVVFFLGEISAQDSISLNSILKDIQHRLDFNPNTIESQNVGKVDSASFFNFNTLYYTPIINKNDNVKYKLFFTRKNEISDMVCYNISGTQEVVFHFYYTSHNIYYTAGFNTEVVNKRIPVYGFFIYNKNLERTFFIKLNESYSFDYVSIDSNGIGGNKKGKKYVKRILKNEFSYKMVEFIYVLDYQLQPLHKIQFRQGKLLYISTFQEKEYSFSEIIKIYPQGGCDEHFNLWTSTLDDVLKFANYGLLDICEYPLKLVTFPDIKHGVMDIWLYPYYEYKKEFSLSEKK
jgi:hypothetical protein